MAVADINSDWANVTLNSSNSNLNSTFDICGEQWADFWSHYNAVEPWPSLAISVIGLVTNIINVLVFSQKSMRKSPLMTIFAALAIADLFSMARNVEGFTLFLWSGRRFDRWNPIKANYCTPASYSYVVFNTVNTVLFVVFHACSVNLTIAAALWRWLGILYPLQSRRWSTRRVAWWTIFGFTAFGTLPFLICSLSIEIQPSKVLLENEWTCDWTFTPVESRSNHFNFIELDIDPESALSSELYIVVQSKAAKLVQLLIYGIFQKIVPCILLTTCTIGLISFLVKTKKKRSQLFGASTKKEPQTMSNAKETELEKNPPNAGTGDNILENNNMNPPPLADQRERRESTINNESSSRTTKTLIIILVIFILTEFPTGFSFILGAIFGPPFINGCGQSMVLFLNMTEYLSSASNFFVYLLTSQNYQKTFFALLYNVSNMSTQLWHQTIVRNRKGRSPSQENNFLNKLTESGCNSQSSSNNLSSASSATTNVSAL